MLVELRSAPNSQAIVFALSRTTPTERMLNRVLACVITLAAITTLPVCHPALLDSSLDGDERTITEARSIVETFSSPGRMVLHGSSPQLDRCPACSAAMETPSESVNGEDGLIEVTSRVALLSDGSFPPSSDTAGTRAEVPAPSPRGIEPLPELLPPISSIP